jgi:aryl-alcohol dehydrogenase-like predicted oxidoreductase
MQYKTLKRSGLKISEVSFGCMSLQTNSSDNESIISKAIDEGITLFDTADIYDKGNNEKLLGNAIRGKRNEVLLSTKVGNQLRADSNGWDWNPGKDYILKAIDESLTRLQTDRVDLYLLHGGTVEDPIDEVIEAFERLIESGKIRAYGISSIRPNVIRDYVAKSNIAAVMTQYSYLDRRPEEATLNLLHENEIGVLARGTLASGLLVDKPAKEYLGLSEKEVRDIVAEFQADLPQGRGHADTAIRYAIDNPAVTTAVIGVRTMQQLEDALAAAHTSPLSLEELQEMHAKGNVNFYAEHR